MISFKKQKLALAESFNFFVNLFNPYENSAIIEDKILTQKKNNRKTFKWNFLNKEENERKIEDFIDEKQIKMGE